MKMNTNNGNGIRERCGTLHRLYFVFTNERMFANKRHRNSHNITFTESWLIRRYLLHACKTSAISKYTPGPPSLMNPYVPFPLPFFNPIIHGFGSYHRLVLFPSCSFLFANKLLNAPSDLSKVSSLWAQNL